MSRSKMTEYEVTGSHVTVDAGTVSITLEQAKARAWALAPINPAKAPKPDPDADAPRGTYEVRKPVQFKRGECFGYDGEPLPKETAANLTDPDEAEALRRALAEQEAGAADQIAALEARVAELEAELAELKGEAPQSDSGASTEA